ncbi:MAG: 50S ribosomal protein L25 [Chloroflexi bacterium ADurb.Bin325]|nr:MAG: 50S ribosomal protein L25 [Chloroflexi bacterium ADurb.Bin325]
MEKLVLKAEPRKTGRHANRELREGSRVPAVVYGRNITAQAISTDRKTLGIALHQSGGGLIELELPGQPPLHVLAREIQRHPTKHHVQHIDFYAVAMNQLVRLQVAVVSDGVAPVLEDAEMVLVRQSDTVEVECFPGDIPEHLVADLSLLKTVDDEITVKDLHAPQGVKILTPAEHVLFSVSASRAALEEEAVEGAEAPDADAVEVIRRGKAEEEEA